MLFASLSHLSPFLALSFSFSLNRVITSITCRTTAEQIPGYCVTAQAADHQANEAATDHTTKIDKEIKKENVFGIGLFQDIYSLSVLLFKAIVDRHCLAKLIHGHLVY